MSNLAFGLLALYAICFAIGIAYFCGFQNGRIS